MKKALILTCITFLALPLRSGLPSFILPVPYHAQETSLWCWAAVGEMVMDYLGEDHKQCDQATIAYHRPNASGIRDCNCCDDKNGCVFPSVPQFAAFDFCYQTTKDKEGALSWPELMTQLVGRRPVVIEWMRPASDPLSMTFRTPPTCYARESEGASTNRHYMVAIGFSTAGGRKWVFIHDPLTDLRVIGYQEFHDGLSPWVPSTDFYNIQKKKPGKECPKP